MKIAILGAMQEEIEPLLAMLPEAKVTDYGKNRYYETAYQNMELVIAYSKIGKVNAALTATTMIEKFGAQQLIFTGVAGGLNPKLKIGDLVAANRLIQHDVDITAFGHPYGFIPESGDFVEVDKTLLAIAHEVAREKGIDLLEGVVATGDQFIASEERRNFIIHTYEADATEMEGASVAYVCDCLGVPFFVLRSISDAADMDAGFNFDAFLKSSAKISAEFALAMVAKLSK